MKVIVLKHYKKLIFTIERQSSLKENIMTKIIDVRTTIWEWIGPVAPMPPHFCTTAGDLVSDVSGSIAGFRFLGWLIVEIECDDGTVGLGNAALAPHACKQQLIPTSNPY